MGSSFAIMIALRVAGVILYVIGVMVLARTRRRKLALAIAAGGLFLLAGGGEMFANCVPR